MLVRRREKEQPKKPASEIRRRKKKVRLQVERCWMCEHYSDSPRVGGGAHLCIKSGEQVGSQDEKPRCHYFKLTNIFTCPERRYQMNTTACVYIRRTKRAKGGGMFHTPEHFSLLYRWCHENCKKGQALEWAAEKHGIPIREVKKEEAKKPLLTRRRETKPALLLRRRK